MDEPKDLADSLSTEDARALLRRLQQRLNGELSAAVRPRPKGLRIQNVGDTPLMVRETSGGEHEIGPRGSILREPMPVAEPTGDPAVVSALWLELRAEESADVLVDATLFARDAAVWGAPRVLLRKPGGRGFVPLSQGAIRLKIDPGQSMALIAVGLGPSHTATTVFSSLSPRAATPRDSASAKEKGEGGGRGDS